MTPEEKRIKRSLYNKEYRARNREAILAREKRYREENPEKVSAATRSYRDRNKEKIKATSAAWYERNKAKVAEYHKTFREQNKDFVDARARAWNQANPDKVAATKAAWRDRYKQEINEYREQNKDKFRVYAHNRRQRQKSSNGVISTGIVERLMTLQKCKCVACRTSLKDGYHIDHIQPLAKGGKHEDTNIQLLCPTCNVRKNAKDPIHFMQQRGFLL